MNTESVNSEVLFPNKFFLSACIMGKVLLEIVYDENVRET